MSQDLLYVFCPLRTREVKCSPNSGLPQAYKFKTAKLVPLHDPCHSCWFLTLLIIWTCASRGPALNKLLQRMLSMCCRCCTCVNRGPAETSRS
jgi:hypothetical protein